MKCAIQVLICSCLLDAALLSEAQHSNTPSKKNRIEDHFDVTQWKTNSLGCLYLRGQKHMGDTLYYYKDKLVGLKESDIISLLGPCQCPF